MARRFRFRLETVQRVRALRELDAKRKVAAKSAEIARLDGLDREAREEILRQQEALRAGADAGRVNPDALRRVTAWIANLRGGIVRRQLQRESLQAELAALQAELAEARKQTRIIEKLRERRWGSYVRELEAEEQAANDELAQQVHGRENELLGVDADGGDTARSASDR